MSVGQASGLALAIAGRARIPVFHYSPNEVKLAVTGDGRADKAQVQAMVARLLALASAPRPADAADALALCVCHLGSAGLRTAVADQTPATDGLARAVAAAMAAESER
jgi:crossover junction endodeoxyribonuclease RuvC